MSSAPSYDLSGRVAVVTGAASDIGRAVAEALARSGASLAICDIDESGLETTRKAINRDDTIVQRVDVTQREQVRVLFETLHERHACLDVLVNVAGVICDASVVETHESDLDHVLAVNVKGTFFACQAAVAAMSEGGSIVNVASSAAFAPYANLSAYSMSKAAIVSLTRVLATEVGPHGVRVNAVAPGYVEGGMSHRHARRADGARDDSVVDAHREAARRRSPLGVTGIPEDVADSVLFLASDAARTMTGQVLHPNGGGPMV